MIAVFPAITSTTVSPNALPGIVKALEKFVVIYRMDGIVAAASGMQIAGKKLLLAGTQYEVVDPILSEVSKIEEDKEAKRKEKENWDAAKKEEEAKRKEEKEEEARLHIRTQKEIEKEKSELRKAGEFEKKQLDTFAQELSKHVEVSTPRFDSALSVEPTFVQVDRPFFGSTIVGVKVIPFQVKSDKKLIELITHDRISYGLERLVASTKRKTLSLYHGVVNKLKIPFLSGGTVTGDVRKDILYASSSHWRNTFVILNYMDLASDEFVNSPEGIKKLHTMGWSSLIFADDVNKRAIFCMREFNGLCSSIQYPFLFSSLSGDHNRVFKDLEDVKASASPIFKMTTSLSRITRLSGKRGEPTNYSGRL